MAEEVCECMKKTGMIEIKTSYILFFPPAVRNPFTEAIEKRLSSLPFGGQYVVVGKRPL
jgi:hypothetical protein